MRDVQPKSVCEDSRGAILVVGIVAGALLVGALWHIAAIGDAMAWRERAQDAADAGAFENAVWHARGMNVIVSINIVMSLVLGVLVLWRTLLLLVTVALIVASILCVVTLGTGCGFAGAVARFEAKMLEQDSKIAKTVQRILMGMSVTEIAVASATPVVAAAAASANTQGSYDVSSALTWSSSVLPNVDIKTILTVSECLGKKIDLGKFEKIHKQYQDFLANPRLGVLVSLPVQAESYSALCGKAAEGILDNLAAMLELTGASSGTVEGIDHAKKFLGPIVGSLPGLFCAPIGEGTMPPGLTDQIGTQAIASCKSQLQGARVIVGDSKGNNEIQYRDDDGKLVNEDDYVKSCAKKKRKEASDQLKGAFNSKDDSGKTDGSKVKDTYKKTECAAPAKVWEWAVNGNVFMRSFAHVRKSKGMASRDDKGLEVADGAASGNVQAIEDDNIAAHAEMYFDCSEPRWMDCRSAAPWQIKWRARLRRIQPTERLVATAVESAIVATLTQMFSGTASMAGEAVTAKLGIQKIFVPKIKDTWYFREVTRNHVQRNLYGSGAFDFVGDFVINHSDTDMTVH